MISRRRILKAAAVGFAASSGVVLAHRPGHQLGSKAFASPSPSASSPPPGAVNAAANGIRGDGTDETAVIQAFLGRFPGAALYFPATPAGYVVSSELVVGSGQTLSGDSTTVFTQATWGRGLFDVYAKDDVTITDMSLRNTAPRANIPGGAYRGDPLASRCSGIWHSGRRAHFERLNITGFVCGLHMFSFVGGAHVAGNAKNNVVADVAVSTVDIGVLMAGQEFGSFTRISGDTEVSLVGNPDHLIYSTTPPGQFCVGITVRDCQAHDVGTHAYQFKQVRGGTFSNLVATNCGGLVNLMNFWDSTITGAYGYGMTMPSPWTNQGTSAATVGARNTYSDVLLRMSTSARAAHLWGTDSHHNGFRVEPARTANTDDYDVQIAGGDRATVADSVIDAQTSAYARGVGVMRGTGHRVERLQTYGEKCPVTVHAGATDTFISLDPDLNVPADPNFPPLVDEGTNTTLRFVRGFS